jgi:hypothetical protein
MTPSRSSFVFLPIALFALAGCAVSTPSVGNLANPLTPTPSAPSTPSTPTPTPTTPSTPTTPTTAPSGTASILYSVSNSIADTNGTLVRAASVVGYSTNALGPIDPATNTFNSTNPAVTINFTDPALGIGGLATDAAGNIYVLAADIDQTYEEIPGTAKIMVFAPPAAGVVTANPIRTISGPLANLDQAGDLTVDAAGNMYLWNEGSNYPTTIPTTIVEFAAGASGNVAPIRTIDVTQYPSNDGSGYPAGLAVDAAGNIVFAVSNPPTVTNMVQTESDRIEIFTPGQSGNATPARTISGPQTQLTQIASLALDPNGNIYVEIVDYGTNNNPAILQFTGGANPAASSAPVTAIAGNATMLDRFLLNSLTVDAAGNTYALDYTFPGPTTYYILSFAPGATGNTVPGAAIPSQTSGLLVAN